MPILTPSNFIRVDQNAEVNFGSRSEMILVGSPKVAYAFCRYNLAISSAESVVLHRISLIAFENLSVIVRRASRPCDRGRPATKSIVMVWNGSSEVESGWR